MDTDDDELDAAMEAAWQRCAMPHPRDILCRQYEEELLKGRPRNAALEKWGPEIEAEIIRDLAGKQ